MIPTHAQHCAPFLNIEISVVPNQKYRVCRLNIASSDWSLVPLAFQENVLQPASTPESPKTKEFVTTHSCYVPIRNHFYEAHLFVSTTGNGFLVTGFPSYQVYGSKKQEDPTLFYFYTPSGELQHEVKLREIFAPEEIVFCGSHQNHQKLSGNCLELSQAKGCAIYYTFQKGPDLSTDGFYVEFSLGRTERSFYYFLPLMKVVSDKKKFETDLVAWLQGEEKSQMFFANALLKRDLNLLQELLRYPDSEIQNATQQHLAKLIPASVTHFQEATAPKWSEWLEEHGHQLQWHEIQQQYQFPP